MAKLWAFLKTVGGMVVAGLALITAWFLYQRMSAHKAKAVRYGDVSRAIEVNQSRTKATLAQAERQREKAHKHAAKAAALRDKAETWLDAAGKIDDAKPAQSLRDRFDAL